MLIVRIQGILTLLVGDESAQAGLDLRGAGWVSEPFRYFFFSILISFSVSLTSLSMLLSSSALLFKMGR